MVYPFDDRTNNRMPYGTPAPFGFGGGILAMPRASAVDELGRVSAQLQQPTTGFGVGRSASAEPTWQVASSDDPTYPYYPRPGYAPPLPDIFAPWKRGAERNLTDMWNYLFRDGNRSSGGGDRNGPGCEEEWKEARRMCTGELAKENPARGVTGGYTNVEDCARGLVSQLCGGNPVTYNPKKR